MNNVFPRRRKNGGRPSKPHLEKAVSLQPLGEDNQSYEGEPITDLKKPLDGKFPKNVAERVTSYLSVFNRLSDRPSTL